MWRQATRRQAMNKRVNLHFLHFLHFVPDRNRN